MSNIAIKVENLGKMYRLGEVGTGTIGHDLNRWWAKVRGQEDPFAKIGETNDRTTKGNSDYVWSLKDINFEVKQGEILGVIGRNGAGKSTLLKLMSKVTSPTTGKIKVNGRIASLLEVGTGFHPELTGRENVFLNGAILGMTKAEIRSKIDEIVDFSGVERYIDTPVKRYSSGMYVRLAFAVAAFLEPEILILDEVLAVGDIEFQRKCLGRMKDVSVNDGRTVLFVSHNIESINKICSKAILLHNGKIENEGEVEEVTKAYIQKQFKVSSYRKWDSISGYPGNNQIKLLEVFVHNTEGILKEIIEVDEAIGITFRFEVLEEMEPFTHGFSIFNESEQMVFSSHDLNTDIRKGKRKPGIYEVTGWIPSHFMAEGVFTISVATFDYTTKPIIHFNEHGTIAFTIVDYIKGNSARGLYPGIFPGIVRPILKWSAKKV